MNYRGVILCLVSFPVMYGMHSCSSEDLFDIVDDFKQVISEKLSFIETFDPETSDTKATDYNLLNGLTYKDHEKKRVMPHFFITAGLDTSDQMFVQIIGVKSENTKLMYFKNLIENYFITCDWNKKFEKTFLHKRYKEDDDYIQLIFSYNNYFFIDYPLIPEENSLQFIDAMKKINNAIIADVDASDNDESSFMRFLGDCCVHNNNKIQYSSLFSLREKDKKPCLIFTFDKNKFYRDVLIVEKLKQLLYTPIFSEKSAKIVRIA